VITTALSFIGTANGIALTGAKPVFVDIGEDLTMAPACVEKAITGKTKAILPVHFTGKLCPMPELLAIAARHRIPLVEDAAPAIGATWRGKKAGSFGVAGCISLNPMKILNACGEAGVVVTDDPEIKDRLLALRYNGLVNRESCHYVSTNGRIDTIQAAILLRRLSRLEALIARRRDIAAYYRTSLAGLVDVPVERPEYRDVYYTFTIKTDCRDALMAYLKEKGIETKIQHPLLMPEHPAYQQSRQTPFPVAKQAVQRLLCIPGHENMSSEQVEHVTGAIRRFFMERA
jgi:dTDP-4-amino-4,6-dideoxygalactose transaminase